MKFLFSIQPGYGHYNPMIPLAKSLEQHGHEVAFATSKTFCEIISLDGFKVFPVGVDWTMTNASDRFPDLKELEGEAQSKYFLKYIFSHVAPISVAKDLYKLINKEWCPDIILRDYWEFGSFIIAKHLKITHITIGLGAFFTDIEQELGQNIASLAMQWNLYLDHENLNLYQHGYIQLAPREYFPLEKYVNNLIYIWTHNYNISSISKIPYWSDHLPTQPNIYITSGTVLPKDLTLMNMAVNTLSVLPFNIILTGNSYTEDIFYNLPKNVFVQKYIPQDDIMPYCDLVISHCGFSTVMGALRYKCPQILLPQTMDQFFHANRCIDLDLGIMVENNDFIASVYRAIQSYNIKESIQFFQQKISETPGPEEAVKFLETL